MWQGSDVDYAQPMIRQTQARFPDLLWCSFERGFYSPENRLRLDELLDHNVRAIVMSFHAWIRC